MLSTTITVATMLLATVMVVALNAVVPPVTAAAAPAGGPLASAASAGCARPVPPEFTGQTRTISVGGVARTYLLFTPPPGRRQAPLPLVLDIHGLGEGDQIEALTTMFGQLGQRDRFVTVFPEGTGSPIGWDTKAGSLPNPDLRYLSDLLSSLESTYCIDTSRVYASGFSDGALMVSLLACTMSTRFAALAAVSGLTSPSPCHPSRRVPIVAVHGTADPILYFNGGVGTGVLNHLLSGGPPVSTTTVPTRLNGPGVPATVRAWAVRDGCRPRPSDTRVAQQVILRAYRCPPGVAVEFYIVVGGGHAWPGSAFSEKIASVTGPTTFEINATSVIWRFFERYRLPG